jgi:hypothetical protein
MTYIVTFTNNGAPVCHWHGYATYADARRAIADADMSIPCIGTGALTPPRMRPPPPAAPDAARPAPPLAPPSRRGFFMPAALPR